MCTKIKKKYFYSIIGIETSCDDSSISFFNPGKSKFLERRYHQNSIHRKYGGIVPNLASIEHIKKINLILNFDDKILKNIEKIFVTYGPGMSQCLLVGTFMSKTISIIKNIPLFGVNHLHGHAWSPFIDIYKKYKSFKKFKKELKYYIPHLGLIISGGNTLLFEINNNLKIKTLANTVDDSAGEALDKGAKMLGLGYPGGIKIEKMSKQGNSNLYNFPISFQKNKNKHEIRKFSFSGIKTKLKYILEKTSNFKLKKDIYNICSSYQMTIIKQVLIRIKKYLSLKKGYYKSIGLSGGVAKNRLLRNKIKEVSNDNNIKCLCVQKKYAEDNASMIAFSGFINNYLDRKKLVNFNEKELKIEPKLRIEN
jgi:N6-L-threonylcarbamoyladenine synthase